LALEDHGFKVERTPSISGTVIHTAITSNQIDLYPEYTGTGLLTILKEPVETDPQKVYDTVKKGYDEKFQITWLNYSPANDSQGLVIRTQVAKAKGITTISDLQKHASELRFASQGAFDQRDDGLPGLEKVYGPFKWKNSTVYDNSLKYEILKKDQADVAPAYTTEGQLVNKDEFTVLKDDKNFWPPYNIAPIVQNKVLKANPEIADILNKIAPKLTTDKMIELNSKVDVDGQEYQAVAKEFYNSIK